MSLLLRSRSTSDKGIFNLAFIRNSLRIAPEYNYESSIRSEIQERFKNAWNSSKDAMWLLDQRGKIIGVNKAFCDLFDQREPDLVGKHYSLCYQKIEKEEVKSSNQDDACYFEQQVLTRAGKNMFLEGINTIISSAYVHIPGKKEETLVFSVFRDITKKNNYLNAKDHLLEILNPVSDAVIIIDLNSQIQSWNKGAETIFRYKEEDVLEKSLTFLQLGLPDNNKLFSKLRKEGKIYNLEIRTQLKDQEFNELLVNIIPIKNKTDDITGASVIIKNVSKVKSAETILKESEERYRTLIETSPDAILMLDVSGVIIMSNRQFCSLINCDDIEDVVGKDLDFYIIRRDKRRLAHDLTEIIDAGIKKDIYFRIKTKNKTVPVEMNASLVLDILGKPNAIICTVRDISERVKYENALKKSELLFRSVWENSNDGMRLTDSNGRIVEVNKSYCAFVGMKREELIGKYFFEVFSDEEASDPEEFLKEYKNNFYKNQFGMYASSKCKYKNDQWIEFTESYKVIETEKNSQLLMGIFHNITEMRKAEEELKSSEKFAAIGKQTAILSHDIKTPLASIKMNIDMLYKNLSLPESNQKSFKIIQKEIKRLVKLLKNVLQYSKEVAPVLSPIQLSALFENIKEFMKPLLDEANAVLLNNVNDVMIQGDYKNLQTVFMHIIENALEAMENGGIIEISSKDAELYSSIFIKDNGCGITDNERIFEPFFTTKSTGTGLGLSIASNILDKHNADIKLISSREGETIFEIRFFKNSRE